VSCSVVPTSFYLVAEGAGVSGEYVVTSQQNDEIIDTFSTDVSEAAQFAIIGGNLFQGSYEANTDESDTVQTVYFDTPGTFSGITNLACSTASSFSGALSCMGWDGASLFQLCPAGIICAFGEPCGGVSIGTSVDSRCQPIQFTAVPGPGATVCSPSS
jgi:hypothetical protein